MMATVRPRSLAREADEAVLLPLDSRRADRWTASSLPLWLTMVIYVTTALLQPILTDQIRYSGGAGNVGWPPTLLSQLANTFAMSSLIFFVLGRLHRGIFRGASLRRIMIATALDFSSGILLTTGLLMLGGGIFVVIYSSTTVWTALWTRCTGQRLASGRWMGVLLVTGGMILSASSGFAEALAANDAQAATSVLLGCLALVGGTALHGAMFVYAENAITHAGLDLLVLCGTMGVLETVVLVLWNLALLATHGVALYVPNAGGAGGAAPLEATVPTLLLLYAALTATNAVHAFTFFSMLERVGAVSSAVLKGLQLVLVFSFSVALFCRLQATQCFTWTKAGGAATVVAGLLVYARSTSGSMHGVAPPAAREAGMDKDP